MIKKKHLLSCVLFTLYLFFSSFAHSEWLDQLSQPANENYYRLKKALDYYENLQIYAWSPLSTLEFQKGKKHPAIPELRERLRLTGDLPETQDNQSEIYDSALEEAVKRFQARHGLKPDGIL